MNFMDGARLGIDEPTVLTQVIDLIDQLRLDQADAYANVCSLLIEMVFQFNVRIILDGLDELENRFAIARGW